MDLSAKKTTFLIVIILLAFGVFAFATEGAGGVEKIGTNSVKKTEVHGLFVRMMAMLVIVVVLAIGVVYMQKKVMPKFTNANGKKIKVVESVCVGRGKMVHLIEVNGKEILIGSANDSIRTLASSFDLVGDISS